MATLTVTVEDTNGNPVTGSEVNLTSSLGSLSDITVTTDGSGQATFSLNGTQAGIAQVHASTVADSTGQTVEVILDPVANIKDLSTTQFTWNTSSGFPTTGFKNASFIMNIEGGNANDFTWVVDQNWVSINVVDNTKVKISFDSEPTGGDTTVTVRGIFQPHSTVTLSYSFTVSKWYIAGNSQIYGSDIKTWCSGQGYDALTTAAQMSAGTNAKRIGGVYSEWGKLSSFSGSSWTASSYYWTGVWFSDRAYLIWSENGYLENLPRSSNYGRPVCFKSL